MKRILFVDDEPKVLDGLRRMLRGLHREWDMAFVEGAREALDRMSEAPFDVVVTDMRMPGLGGAELLNEVRRRHPATVRIVLSGQCDRETVLKSAGPTHQFLTKPCDSQVLKETVARACQLRDRLPDEWLQRLVSRMQGVPCRPEACAELAAELESPVASIQRAGEIIARDMGLSAKVLQMVNSGFFGTPRRTSDAAYAAGLLGLDTIKGLAALPEIVYPWDARGMPAGFLASLAQHGLGVARRARRIAQTETSDRMVRDDAFLAGLLHDVGILVLAHEAPDRFGDVLEVARRESLPFAEVEQQLLSATHAEVGAYLVALWGLPDPVVEAIAQHHAPFREPQTEFTALSAVCAADAAAEEDGTLGYCSRQECIHD
jgi:HD-like signal output (HDOD) protein